MTKQKAEYPIFSPHMVGSGRYDDSTAAWHERLVIPGFLFVSQMRHTTEPRRLAVAKISRHADRQLNQHAGLDKSVPVFLKSRSHLRAPVLPRRHGPPPVARVDAV